MPIGDPIRVNEGDSAFAWNVQQVADILLGQRATRVRFTKWGHLTEPSLQVANRLEGPILELLGADLVTRVMLVDQSGVRSTKVNGYFDFKFQAAAPDAPGAGTDTIRFYARDGQFWFKSEASGELQIPIGPPPGSSLRWGFWMAG
jgi:hypothetical protein